MKKHLWLCAMLWASMAPACAQLGGGAITRGLLQRESSVSPEQNERNKRQIAARYDTDSKESNATFVDAAVLINVRADEYVAVFALSQQDKTVSEADAKLSASIQGFQNALRSLGVKESDTFVDFVLQNRVYSYDIETEKSFAKERLVGFELKKNISIRFQNKTLLPRLTSVAAKLGIYDLVKVDYIVKNISDVQARLQSESAKIIKSKLARYNQFGVKNLDVIQVVVDEPSIYYPVENYATYQAAQSNYAQLPSGYVVEGALKSGTFYFDPLNGNDFDLVVNPVVVEPVVQFTSYVAVKCRAPETVTKP